MNIEREGDAAEAATTETNKTIPAQRSNHQKPEETHERNQKAKEATETPRITNRREHIHLNENRGSDNQHPPPPSAAEEHETGEAAERTTRMDEPNQRDNPEAGLPTQRKTPQMEREGKSPHEQEATMNAGQGKEETTELDETQRSDNGEGRQRDTGKKQRRKGNKRKRLNELQQEHGKEAQAKKRTRKTEVKKTNAEGNRSRRSKGGIRTTGARGGSLGGRKAKRRNENAPAEEAEEWKRDEQRKGEWQANREWKRKGKSQKKFRGGRQPKGEKREETKENQPADPKK